MPYGSCEEEEESGGNFHGKYVSLCKANAIKREYNCMYATTFCQFLILL